MKRTVHALTLVLVLPASPVGAAPILGNGSFETNNVPAGSYRYAMNGLAAAPWDFSGGAGISADYSAWGGNTPYGNYFTFLQNTSVLQQTFISDGRYELDLSFAMIERAGYSPNQVVQVRLDDLLLAAINPDSTWTTYSYQNLVIGAGSHTLKFSGTYTFADASAFLDNVQMTATAIPEPPLLGLVGLGLAGLVLTRRRRA